MNFGVGKPRPWFNSNSDSRMRYFYTRLLKSSVRAIHVCFDLGTFFSVFEGAGELITGTGELTIGNRNVYHFLFYFI